MNREEIEKRFWEQDFYDESMLDFNLTKIKSFFLDEILPEVLREIIPIETNMGSDYIEYGWNSCIQSIKKDAKEKYNLTL